jgi:hypothetical protein
MGDVTVLIERALDELAPPRPGPDRWDEIERAALGERQRLRRRRLMPFLAAPVAAAAVIAVVVLAWPFSGGSHGTLLQRAAAAIGDGPVLHAVIQSGWGGTEVDLATGQRTAVHGEEELWYDPQRGVHDITLFAGVVQGDSLYPPGRVAYLDKTLAFLATDYRQALKNGTAKVLGEDTIDGQPVYWIRVDTQMLPDVADGKLHEWAHDVAVSATTLKPVATRETRDGQLSPDGISKIRSVETLGSGQGDFTAPPAVNGGGDAMRFQLTGSLAADEANAVLGRTMLWAGPTFDGLPLSRIAKQMRSQGYDRSTGRWATTHTGITLFYGPSTGGGIGQPAPSGPYLQVSETLTPDDQFQRGVRNYTPPEGKLLIFGDGNIGVMQSHGVHLFLEGSSGDLVLAAAKSLVPRTG